LLLQLDFFLGNLRVFFGRLLCPSWLSSSWRSLGFLRKRSGWQQESKKTKHQWKCSETSQHLENLSKTAYWETANFFILTAWQPSRKP
jgi:hypothetical protein